MPFAGSDFLTRSMFLQNRWIILCVLFFARATMAFQFQSVAALSPLMIDSLLLSIVEIGLLIGLYLGPGVIVAILGGSVASVFGDKRIGVVSLILMFLGSVHALQASTFGGLVAGRVMAGIGGVVVNVLMTKMVIDWFAGRNLATAMAIFISSWPMGIGLALVTLPWLADQGGLDWAWAFVALVTALALVSFWVIYRTPEGATARGRIAVVDLPWVPLTFAALVWGFYNAALAMVFGFGPIILVDSGLSNAGASAATSLFMFAIVIAAPLGGWVADRSGRRDALILFTLVCAIVLFPLMLYLSASTAWIVFALAGFLIGLSPGAIVSMTSQILPINARAFGTGVYYSIYYAVMMVSPPLAGALADKIENVSVTFLLASGMMSICILALLAFRKTALSTD